MPVASQEYKLEVRIVQDVFQLPGYARVDICLKHEDKIFPYSSSSIAQDNLQLRLEELVNNALRRVTNYISTQAKDKPNV